MSSSGHFFKNVHKLEQKQRTAMKMISKLEVARLGEHKELGTFSLEYPKKCHTKEGHTVVHTEVCAS